MLKNALAALSLSLALCGSVTAAPQPEKRASVSVVSSSTIAALTPYAEVRCSISPIHCQHNSDTPVSSRARRTATQTSLGAAEVSSS